MSVIGYVVAAVVMLAHQYGEVGLYGDAPEHGLTTLHERLAT